MSSIIHAVTDSAKTSSGSEEIDPCGLVVYEDQPWPVQQSEIQTRMLDSASLSGRSILRTNQVLDAHLYSMGPFKTLKFISTEPRKRFPSLDTKEVKRLHDVLYLNLGTQSISQTTLTIESIAAGLKRFASLIDELSQGGEYKLSPGSDELVKLVIERLAKIPDEQIRDEQIEEWSHRLAKDIVDAEEQ